MNWQISYFNATLQQEILDWPTGLQARYIRLTDMMLAYGPNLGMPHTRALASGLFEIRVKATEGIGRVFYCCLAEQNIIVLHCFIKKTEKTPKRELEIARQQLNQVKNNAIS